MCEIIVQKKMITLLCSCKSIIYLYNKVPIFHCCYKIANMCARLLLLVWCHIIILCLIKWLDYLFLACKLPTFFYLSENFIIYSFFTHISYASKHCLPFLFSVQSFIQCSTPHSYQFFYYILTDILSYITLFKKFLLSSNCIFAGFVLNQMSSQNFTFYMTNTH